jgi:hypothetical protein
VDCNKGIELALRSCQEIASLERSPARFPAGSSRYALGCWIWCRFAIDTRALTSSLSTPATLVDTGAIYTALPQVWAALALTPDRTVEFTLS